MKDKHKEGPLKATPPEDIALSISGGGHRATLFGLGVLLALVDRGLNRRVMYVSSVSGGSILNAFVALHARFNDATLSPEVFDHLAGKIVDIIVNKGVLTKAVLGMLLSAIIVPPLFFIVLAYYGAITWYVTVSLVVLWLGLALLRGLVIEWLIELRYFPPSFEFTLFPPNIVFSRKRLGDLQRSSVEHALCCTDLLQPGPVHFSSSGVGDSQIPGCFYSGVGEGGRWLARRAAHVPVAAAVRASAAFPGIPPRLFRFRSELEDVAGYQNLAGEVLYDPTPHLHKTWILSDGGVWNNLGTQVLRELNWNSLKYGNTVLITMDASVPMKSQRTIPYGIPLWALIRSLLRVINVQHENTVEPRLNAMRSRMWGRVFGTSGGIRDRRRLDALMETLELDEGQRDIFEALNERGYLTPEGPWDIPLSLEDAPDGPLGLYMDLITGVPSTEERYGAVRAASNRGAELFRRARIDIAEIKTHLDRVQGTHAIGLLARGYLSALLWTVELKPLDTEDVERLERMPQRLEAMVSAT